MFAEITLMQPINEKEMELKNIFAEVQSITQSEYVAAGKKDIKPAYKFTVWSFEYDGQTDVQYGNERLTVYRTYTKDGSDKIELYTEERSGRRWQTW